MKVKTYTLWYIDNYGNEKFLIDLFTSNGCEVIKYGINTGFYGCDPPVEMRVKGELTKIQELLKTKTPDICRLNDN